MTSVVEATAEGDADDDRDPFGGARIEVPEGEMRAVAKPQILVGRAKRKIDEVATRLTYGR
ncbi:hypothetical protein ACFQMA_07270 [Halosimplex aquaticum]|uniref:Uncharacterized protein n=1 Tax=Halosimplex aquaticum TaxID=3026162 RepID=A0ABD5XX61_9EURY|nr:hypothetical protein [Halosimplex aquaticum]